MVGRLLLLLAAGAAVVWLREGEAPLTGQTPTASGMSSLLGDAALHMTALVAVWSVGAALVGWLRRLPGGIGWAADRAWAWLVPTALRAALISASGAVVATSSAAAVDSPAPAATARWEVGRPLTGASLLVPVTPTATSLPPPAVSAEAPAQLRVVAPGDSLWAIAAHHLGPGATPAQVAAEWPRWYASNRDVVGPDPDLLRVGTVLEAPAVGVTP